MASCRQAAFACLSALWTIGLTVSPEVHSGVINAVSSYSNYDGIGRISNLDQTDLLEQPSNALSHAGGADALLPEDGTHQHDDSKPIYSRKTSNNRVGPTKCSEYDRDMCETEKRKCVVTPVWCGLKGQEPFCYALWHNKSGEILLKNSGCWLPSNEGECMQRQCLHTKAEPSRKDHADGPIYFCCCNQTSCNTHFKYEVDDNAVLTTQKPISAYAEPVDARVSSKTTNSSVLWPVLLFCMIMIMVALIIGAVIYYAAVRRRASGKSSSFWSLSSAQNQRHRSSNTVGADLMGGRNGTEMHQRDPLLNPPEDMPDDVENLNSLVLIERKSKSRFSEVWLGEFNSRTDGMQRCAVKLVSLTDKTIGDNEVLVYRFLRQLEHANLLHFLGKRQIYEASARPQLQIVTEFHANGSLLSYLKANVLDVNTALNIITNMVEGLSFLHFDRRNGKPIIAHRDFKSSNVLVKDNLDACISDFGLAAVFFDGEEFRSHEQVGTDRYMAPELLDGAISKTREAFLHIDMYACGLVVWEVLSRTAMHADDPVPPYRMPLEAELAEYDNNTTTNNGAMNVTMPMPTREGDEKQKLIRKLVQAVVHDKKRPVGRSDWNMHEMTAEAWRTAEQSLDSDPEGRPSAALWLSRLRADATAMHSNAVPSQMPQHNSFLANMPVDYAPLAATADNHNFYAGYPSPSSTTNGWNTMGSNMTAHTHALHPSGSSGFVNLLPQSYFQQYQNYAFSNHPRLTNSPAASAADVLDSKNSDENPSSLLPSSTAVRMSALPDVCTPQVRSKQPVLPVVAASSNIHKQSHHYYNDVVAVEHQLVQRSLPVSDTTAESPPPPLPPRAPAKT